MKLKLTVLSAALACLTTLFTGCESRIEMPKKSSDGYQSFRLYKEIPEEHEFYATREDVVHKILQDEMVSVFNANGLTESETDAELIVTYLVLVQNNAVSTGISDYYVNSGSEIVSYAHKKVAIEKDLPINFEAGTLVVDVIDAKERKLIYRDYASKEILPQLTIEERNQRAKEAVEEALEGFFN